MKESLSARIRGFILGSISEKTLAGEPDPFRQGPRSTGTELRLDAGEMDEAASIWSAEMFALTTNNTLLNIEIRNGIKELSGNFRAGLPWVNWA
jgi:transaldolase